ncbi:MAG: transglycosylase SLT domain-containing protein [Anaerolineales bacterium]
MPDRHTTPPFDQTATFSQGGCLSGFLIPPLAVICIGVVMAFLLLGSGIQSTLAASSVQNDSKLAQGTPDQMAKSSAGNPNQSGAISPIFQPEVQYWSAAIQVWATAAGLDPNLAATVMQIESCGDPRAHSRAGAMGLFQVMPYHFAVGDDPYNPDTNAERGLAYLKRSLEAANGNARLALAGYNGGIGVIGRSELNWAAETQRYAYWGSGIYAEASNGATKSLRLQEWLAASGASLCRQAGSRLGINP